MHGVEGAGEGRWKQRGRSLLLPVQYRRGAGLATGVGGDEGGAYDSSAALASHTHSHLRTHTHHIPEDTSFAGLLLARMRSAHRFLLPYK